MQNNLLKLLAVPLILVLAMAIIVFLNQPKVKIVSDVNYVEMNGDEYLAEEITTTKEEQIGGYPETKIAENYFFPNELSDCESRQGAQKENCYLLYSALKGKPEGCEMLKDQTSRDDCFTRVAFVNSNPEFCEKVTLGYSQCVVDVAIETKNAVLCEKASKEKDQCYLAVAEADVNKCSPSEDRAKCIQAVLENNSSLCEKILSYKDFCYNAIAKELKDETLCDKVGKNRDSCLFKVALAKNDVSICEKLSETRDNCVAWIAFNTNNKELCYKAGSETQSCLQDLS
ncbi:MAG: hypothetical protein QXD98_02265 [Candidatus Diapherotrites archaeon]